MLFLSFLTREVSRLSWKSRNRGRDREMKVLLVLSCMLIVDLTLVCCPDLFVVFGIITQRLLERDALSLVGGVSR